MRKEDHIIQVNQTYWNANADSWFGATALPMYGVKFATEDELHLFGDVSGKKMLDICCGSGHSLKYHADRNAGELWGVDLSQKQIENARAYLERNGYRANLICGAMESELNIPKNYFDYVYSIYGIGWTTDLEGTFQKIASYLKKDGTFIFSWHHTLNYCVSSVPDVQKEQKVQNQLIFQKSYFDESYFSQPLDGSEIILCNRKISTYVNALAKAGFCIEQMIEQTDRETMESSADNDPKIRKAQMLPLSLCFKARKLS
jgi:SAM-dependent methyltransferase